MANPVEIIENKVTAERQKMDEKYFKYIKHGLTFGKEKNLD